MNDSRKLLWTMPIKATLRDRLVDGSVLILLAALLVLAAAC